MFSIAYRRGDFEVVLSADTIDDVLALDDAYNAEEVDDDGWITWNGGNCISNGESRVEYRMRNGEEGVSHAKSLRWTHLGYPGDVVAYKVVENA